MKTLSFAFWFVIMAAFAGAAEGPHAGLIVRYEAVRAALAGDDLEAARKAAIELSDAAGTGTESAGTLAKPASAIAASKTIEEARGHFKVVSAALEPLVKRDAGVYVMTCPMVKGGVWIQTTPKVSNPYMGKAMLQCGQQRKP